MGIITQRSNKESYRVLTRTTLTGLALSLKMEKHLESLMSADESHRTSQSLSNAHSNEAQYANGNGNGTQYGIQYQNRDGDESVIWGAGGRGHLPGTPRSSAFISNGQNGGMVTPTGTFALLSSSPRPPFGERDHTLYPPSGETVNKRERY